VLYKRGVKTYQKGKIVSVNVSAKRGVVKMPVAQIELNEQGIVGDGHSGAWHRQVSLLPVEQIRDFASEIGRDLAAGEFAENITTEGLDFKRIAVMDRLLMGDVELEVSQIGKKCHGDACAIYREVGRCVMPHAGIFCRVIKEGVIKPDMVIQHNETPLDIQVITLSDRASRGEYEDLSGPRVETLLHEFFETKRWHPKISRCCIPDHAETYATTIKKAQKQGIHLIISTGSTGVSPSDIAPDVVQQLADKQIPGIMEHIRIKYGTENPRALLSRSVAAVAGRTLIIALPGSIRAVDEYMAEIVKSLPHLLLTIQGLGWH